MKFDRLLEIVGEEPLFESGLLLVGDVDVGDVQRQLVRWTRSGRILAIRRGLYALAPPYRRVVPHPFLVANALVHGSYVSGEAALAWHGLIPESVPVTTSVSLSRPGRWDTGLGSFLFQHLHPSLFFGYEPTQVAENQQALVARPGKALLDLIHLRPGGDAPLALEALRLQGLDRLDLDELDCLARRGGRPKLLRAAAEIRRLAGIEREEYEVL